mmetsp:Transcript_19697/g.14443  ORF Transcript_19697/g.14443 Transcript_19697/m.14443 type:complete len:92 (+) Transcript_19697:6-281(+)
MSKSIATKNSGQLSYSKSPHLTIGKGQLIGEDNERSMAALSTKQQENNDSIADNSQANKSPFSNSKKDTEPYGMMSSDRQRVIDATLFSTP